MYTIKKIIVVNFELYKFINNVFNIIADSRVVCVDQSYPPPLEIEIVHVHMYVLHMYIQSLYKGVIYTTETFNFRLNAYNVQDDNAYKSSFGFLKLNQI